MSVTQTITQPTLTPPLDHIVAIAVTESDYMEHYAATHHEWLNGVVITMSPANLEHMTLFQYLFKLLDAYLAVNPIATLLHEPFVMALDTPTFQSRRQPDIQLLRHEHQARLTPTYVDGPADICIEIVSPESVARDYGEKFQEYEAGGVAEYWIIDPQRHEANFHRLSEDHTYKRVQISADSPYTTPLLSRFQLHIPTVWQHPLPTIFQIMEQVHQMMATD